VHIVPTSLIQKFPKSSKSFKFPSFGKSSLALHNSIYIWLSPVIFTSPTVPPFFAPFHHSAAITAASGASKVWADIGWLCFVQITSLDRH
jgi:hypothetical protein